MSTSTQDLDLTELRQRTRAAQHATSFPLLVMGVLLVNYGIVGFGSQPVAWRYAGALAFVAVWGLGKANEYSTGVGRGRGDYLAIACGVFVATQLTVSSFVLQASWITQYRLEGMWVVIIGGGLLAAGLSARAPALAVWGVITGIGGLAIAIIGYQKWVAPDPVTPLRVGTDVFALAAAQQVRLAILLGVALTVAGFVVFLRERRLS